MAAWGHICRYHTFLADNEDQSWPGKAASAQSLFAGGQVLTVGSSDELRKIASVALPAPLCNDIQKQPVREEFTRELIKLSGGPLVAIQNAGYVIANLVRKKGSEKVIAHFVNYGPPAESVNVRLNLAGVVQRISPKNRLALRIAKPAQYRPCQ